MKSVIEILGQILFGISFDMQDSFEEYLGEPHRAFLAMLRVIEEDLPRLDVVVGGKPRKRGDRERVREKRRDESNGRHGRSRCGRRKR